MRVVITDPESNRIHAIHELSAGENAYVLCTTLWHNEQLMKDFQSDAYIRIHDPAEFGRRVAGHIPGFVEGGEGPCMYHRHRYIESNVSEADRASVDKAAPSVAAALDAIGHYPLFLKHRSYSHQAEYRLVWTTDAPLKVAHLDIKVPEARDLCSRPGVFEFDDAVFNPPASR